MAPDVLVGAFGRVGRMVRRHWPAGRELIATGRGAKLEGPNPEGAGLRWAPLEGPAALLAHLDKTGQQPAALVMLAGVTPAPGLDEAALHSGNTAIARACLAAARAAGIGRVLLASSSAVYGVDPQGRPFAETAPLAPLSPYGRAKQAMEAEADPFREAGMTVTALRIGNVAGADALLFPLTEAMARQGAPRPPIRLHGFADGQGPLRSYIGAGTMARVLAALTAHPAPLPPTPLSPAPLPDVLNLAAPCPLRMRALAQAAGWPCEMVAAPPGAHQTITLDCGRLAGLFPFGKDDSDPAAMVAQWKATLPR